MCRTSPTGVQLRETNPRFPSDESAKRLTAAVAAALFMLQGFQTEALQQIQKETFEDFPESVFRYKVFCWKISAMDLKVVSKCCFL